MCLTGPVFLSCTIVGVDYQSQEAGESFSISFMPGEIADKCEMVVIIDDNLFEGNEVFTMILQNTSAVAKLDPCNTTVIIIDNDDNEGKVLT